MKDTFEGDWKGFRDDWEINEKTTVNRANEELEGNRKRTIRGLENLGEGEVEENYLWVSIEFVMDLKTDNPTILIRRMHESGSNWRTQNRRDG